MPESDNNMFMVLQQCRHLIVQKNLLCYMIQYFTTQQSSYTATQKWQIKTIKQARQPTVWTVLRSYLFRT